jgi:hypothetical protein
MTRHELKTWPKYFAAVRSGQKRFEIRRNDREFKVGDILVLREFDPEDDAYTGQSRNARSPSCCRKRTTASSTASWPSASARSLPHPDADAEVSADSLATWHETAASNAALRGQEARKVSARCYAKSNMASPPTATPPWPPRPPPRRLPRRRGADRPQGLSGAETSSFGRLRMRFSADLTLSLSKGDVRIPNSKKPPLPINGRRLLFAWKIRA